MSEKTPLQELMATARQKAAEIAADPLTVSAMSKAAAGAERAATVTRDRLSSLGIVGRDEVVEEMTRAIDELVEVVLVQQELIEALMHRVAALEASR
jgi:hypothetical protein